MGSESTECGAAQLTEMGIAQEPERGAAKVTEGVTVESRIGDATQMKEPGAA